MLRNKQIPLIYLLLTAAALMAFWQVSYCDFINYDDTSYVTKNIHIRNGITTEAIGWAFTTGYAGNWHPLTWISHILDVQLFGLEPRWHHMTNLLFHIVNTLLLFFVFYRMTKAPWKSAFVAALFALHPLHVESVAWVAERKDVLSTFFWMLTMAAYISYVEHPRLRTYLPVFAFLALGLTAKPMLVTLPFVLLLLDYWPLGRMQEAGSREQGARSETQNPKLGEEPLSANKRKLPKKPTDQVITQSSVLRGAYDPAQPYGRIAQRRTGGPQSFALRPLLWEKMPLFALAALSSIVTFVAQQKAGMVKSIGAFPLGARIGNTFVSYIAYIRKMVWPNNLAVHYPHPGLWPLWQVLGAVLLLGAVTFAVIRGGKRFPYLAMGWLWFAGTLVPVIGIVQVGQQAMADRYTYIPLIGLFIMAAWGIPELLKKLRYRKEVLVASSALVLACLFIVTWIQVGYWRSSITLFDHTLKVTDRNYIIYQNRGSAYCTLGDYRRAIDDYDRSIEINPGFVEAYHNRGVAYANLGDYRKAISDYDRAIAMYPGYESAYHNRLLAIESPGKKVNKDEPYKFSIPKQSTLPPPQ